MVSDDWDWLTDVLEADEPPDVAQFALEEASVGGTLAADDVEVVSIFRLTRRQKRNRAAPVPLRRATNH